MSIWKVVFLQHSYRLLSIAALLFHALGLLPYLEMSPRLSLVTRAIGRAMVDLPSFLVVFLAVLSSYAFIGHLLFGPHIKEWRTLLGAYETCWDMMRWSGWRFERLRINFEAESEDDATPLITSAVFYYSYVGLMQFMYAPYTAQPYMIILRAAPCFIIPLHVPFAGTPTSSPRF